jgi:hypothetical protein
MQRLGTLLMALASSCSVANRRPKPFGVVPRSRFRSGRYIALWNPFRFGLCIARVPILRIAMPPTIPRRPSRSRKIQDICKEISALIELRFPIA